MAGSQPVPTRGGRLGAGSQCRSSPPWQPTQPQGDLYHFWWHNTDGLADTTPRTPSRLTATAGFVVLLVAGVVRLSWNGAWMVKAVFALSLALFVVLWTVVILLT